MAWPHDAEVAAVEGRELRLPVPLDDGEHGRVNESDSKVAVGRVDLLYPVVVFRSQIVDREGAPTNIVEKAQKRPRAQARPRPVVDLNQDGRRDDALFPRSREKPCARPVLFVIRVQRGDQRPGVDDERHGSGLYSSSLARRERSPAPEWNFPKLRGLG